MDERGQCYKSELTIREHFAAMAMQAWRTAHPTKAHDWVAENAGKDADALLRALAAGGEG